MAGAARERRGTGPVRRHLGTLSILLACMGCSETVAQGVDEATANHAVLLLQRAGVAASKEADSKRAGLFQVTVSSGDASYAVSQLAAEGPTGPKSSGLVEALGGSALIPSPRSEHARILLGTAGEIEKSLVSLDGVLSARVHLAVADPEALPSGDTPPNNTASVLLRYRDGKAPLTPEDVTKLVSGAVPDLAPERVTVVLKAVPSAPAREALSRFGPLTVSRSSVGTLRWIATAVLLMNVVLGLTVAWLWRKLHSQAGEPS